MIIIFGSDHAGFVLKRYLIAHLYNSPGFSDEISDIRDIGNFDPSGRSVDYPDYAHRLCDMMAEHKFESRGILICGTGIGMSIVANRYKGIRCAVAVCSEMALAARLHNDANVLALGARLIDEPTAITIVNAFFGTAYEGGRHDRRLAKIDRRRDEADDGENGVRGIFNGRPGDMW